MFTSSKAIVLTMFVLLTCFAQTAYASDGQNPSPDGHPAAEEEYYRPNQSPYEVMPELEIPLLVGGALVTSVPRLMVSESAGPWCGLDCDPDDVNAFDRLTIDMASQLYGDISDYVMYAYVPMPYLFDLIDVAVSDPHDGWIGYGKDFLVILETMAVTLYVNGLVAMIVRRPRPYVYNDDVDDDFRLDGEASMSFYSGHTSVVFALATAYGMLFMKRHPDSALIAPVWIFGYAMASTVGVFRVLSGSHFPTDVIVGAATGAGLGLLIPWLHELPEKENAETGFSIRPVFAGTSAGIAGSF